MLVLLYIKVGNFSAQKFRGADFVPKGLQDSAWDFTPRCSLKDARPEAGGRTDTSGAQALTKGTFITNNLPPFQGGLVVWACSRG